MTQITPKLGEWYMITGGVRKHRRSIGKDFSDYPRETRWERHDKSSKKMMYVGKRWISEGVTRLAGSNYEGDDYYREFKATARHEVWLFVESERHNPIYVFPEDVQEIS